MADKEKNGDKKGHIRHNEDLEWVRWKNDVPKPKDVHKTLDTIPPPPPQEKE